MEEQLRNLKMSRTQSTFLYTTKSRLCLSDDDEDYDNDDDDENNDDEDNDDDDDDGSDDVTR